MQKMYNAVSYYAIASWAHGVEAFHLKITGTGDQDQTYAFKTHKVGTLWCVCALGKA